MLSPQPIQEMNNLPQQDSEQYHKQLDSKFAKMLEAKTSKLPFLDPKESFEGKEALEELCNSLLHTEDSIYPTPKPLLSLGGSLVCRSGEITNIAGASKTGKTALISAAIAACLNPDADNNLGFIAYQKSNVLTFDFEMPKDLFQENIDKILKIANLKSIPENLKPFPLRGLELESKKELVEYAIKKFRPDLVVLDTVADLQAGQNDEEDSNKLIEWVMMLADTLEFGVLTTLHFNPGSQGKTRGHLGSQLERKTYHQLKVEKENDGSSKVSSQLNRQASIEPIYFYFNKQENMHTLLTDPKVTKLKQEFESLEFESGKLYTYNELVGYMEDVLKWSNGKAKERLKKFKNIGLIFKENMMYKIT